MADVARGERLRALREARHWSQETAAHRIGVSVKTLRAWEKGGRIKWANAKRAGEELEVDPESLVSLDRPGASEPPEADYAMATKADLVAMQSRLLGEIAKVQKLLQAQQDTRRRRAPHSAGSHNG